MSTLARRWEYLYSPPVQIPLQRQPLYAYTPPSTSYGYHCAACHCDVWSERCPFCGSGNVVSPRTVRYRQAPRVKHSDDLEPWNDDEWGYGPAWAAAGPEGYELACTPSTMGRRSVRAKLSVPVWEEYRPKHEIYPTEWRGAASWPDEGATSWSWARWPGWSHHWPPTTLDSSGVKLVHMGYDPSLVSGIFWDKFKADALVSDEPWMGEEARWNIDVYRVEPSPSQLMEQGRDTKRRAGRLDQNYRYTYRVERGVCSLGQDGCESICSLRNCGVCRLLQSGMRSWRLGVRFSLGPRQPSEATWTSPFAADRVARQGGVGGLTRYAIVCKTKPGATKQMRYGHAAVREEDGAVICADYRDCVPAFVIVYSLKDFGSPGAGY